VSDQNPYGNQGQNPYGQPGQPGQAPGYGYPQSGSQDQNPYAQQQPPGAPPGYGYPGQAAPVPAGAQGFDPSAPYGYDPYGRPYSDKSKIVAGVLQLFIGSLGIGRFYTGHTGMALGQLFTCGGLGIWSLIDGIILLTSDNKTDAQGRILRS
jgi:TM2 domain-containing membrane protein YozV